MEKLVGKKIKRWNCHNRANQRILSLTVADASENSKRNHVMKKYGRTLYADPGTVTPYNVGQC